MKKKNLNKWGKTLMVALMGIGMTTFTGCEKNPTGGGGSTSGDSCTSSTRPRTKCKSTATR